MAVFIILANKSISLSDGLLIDAIELIAIDGHSFGNDSTSLDGYALCGHVIENHPKCIHYRHHNLYFRVTAHHR